MGGLRQGPSKALKVPVGVYFQWSQERRLGLGRQRGCSGSPGSVIPTEGKLAGPGGFPLH